MSLWDDHAAVVYDLDFEHFGDPAAYTPVGGAAVACTAVRVRDVDTDGLGGHAGAVVTKEAAEIRVSELAQPATGAALDFLDAVGGSVIAAFKVVSFKPDDERRVWRLILQKA